MANPALEKYKKNPTPLTGFFPPPLYAPHNAITPGQIIRHHRTQRKGRYGGTDTVLSIIYHYIS
jgi:hypothetical protein